MCSFTRSNAREYIVNSKGGVPFDIDWLCYDLASGFSGNAAVIIVAFFGQILHDFFQRSGIKVWQEATNRVEELNIHALCKRSTHHTANKLCNIGIILMRAHREDDLGTRTVPTGADSFLSEKNTNIAFALHILRLNTWHLVRSKMQIAFTADNMCKSCRAV